jgi:hypothetical protein
MVREDFLEKSSGAVQDRLAKNLRHVEISRYYSFPVQDEQLSSSKNILV